MNVEVQLLTPLQEGEYSRFLDTVESALFYHSLPYRDFLSHLLGCESKYLIAARGGDVEGVLPVMCIGGPCGKVINSLPFYGSNGSVIAISQSAREALLDRFNCMADEPEVCSATMIENPINPLELEEAPRYDFLDERIGQITRLDFNGEESVLLSMIDGSARRNIRKATNSKVRVYVDNTALGFLGKVHRENMQSIGGRAKSERFFVSIPDFFKEGKDYKIYVAEIDGEPVAALLLFYFNKTVEYFTPAIKAEFRSCQPMAAILHRAMLDASREGFRRWNWGGTWLSQEGVYRFKKKWAAQDCRYRYFVRVRNKKLLGMSRADILSWYPDFYVLPFDMLGEGEK